MLRLFFFYTLLLCTTLHAAPSLRRSAERATFSQKQIDGAKQIQHLIVIMQENWSFDALYGTFPGVEGLSQASAESIRQTDRAGAVLPQLPPCLHARRKEPYAHIPQDLPNGPFLLEPYLPMTEPTGDLVHRFYSEQRQINGGRMNGFAAWSNAGGFVMSYYDISKTRMGKLAKNHTICDHFFHSCYGSSMCGSLMLFSARVPRWLQAPQSLIIDPTESGIMSFKGKVTPEGYAVEDLQPFYPPHHSGISHRERLPAQNDVTIGDLLSRQEVSWGWYAEGWDDAVAGHAAHDFPYHHQAPVYFTQFAPGTQARREHLFDLKEFYVQLKRDQLPAVCFIRSLERHSEHPGSASLLEGLDWCADLIEAIQASPAWQRCAIIVTYDENGGRWDHVPPPLGDAFGPGTRIPTAIISPFAKKGFVDKTSYETVSILKFIEERWGLPALAPRDAKANNLLNAFDFN